METQLYKVFSGPAIDVNIIRKHLESNGIKCFVENRRGDENESKYSVSTFDPTVVLEVEAENVESAVQLIDTFLKTKAE
ncbi:MAG: DUF2007 domain-containing protein [Bacteroidales bacterium]|jgi:hypothetical protein|nr:DUF2007 domain-containing protein [Bacteroidales bacterium]